MGSLIVIAARNLRRHLRRTLISASAISFGLILFIFSSTIQDGMYRDMIQKGVSMMAGHVVIQGNGFQEERDAEIVVKDSTEVVAKLRETFPGKNVVRRIFMQGLLTSPNGSMGVGVTAIEPTEEVKVSDFQDKIVEGAFVGEKLTDIIIGATLAETLDVKLGAKVVLMLQVGPELESRLFRVVGVYRTGASELDGFFAMVNLKAAQDLLKIDDGASQIAVQLDPDANFEAERDKARAALSGAGAGESARADLEVLTWKQAMPDLWEYMVSDRVGNYAMLFILGFIGAFGILNTMLMSVLERVREFGVLLSIGMSPRRLAGLVFIEATMLGTIASFIGFVVGVAISYPTVSGGLDYGAMLGGAENMSVAGMPVELMIYGYYSWSRLIFFSCMTIVLAILAGLYPVWFTSRLTPVKAMEHV